MKKYSMDMSRESNKVLLPEGWRKFKILKCEESVSKKGNEMFIFDLQDALTKKVEQVYAIATQGKRWFLKSLLAACDVPASQDGVYDWDIEDVLNEDIMGKVEHIEEDWINREGKTVTSTKGKITEIGKVGEVSAPLEQETFGANHQEEKPPVNGSIPF